MCNVRKFFLTMFQLTNNLLSEGTWRYNLELTHSGNARLHPVVFSITTLYPAVAKLVSARNVSSLQRTVN